MPARILHLSDLHTGTREDTGVEAALVDLTASLSPELIVASGDLTHRGRRAQHERAHAFLTSLGPPVLAVPGNHDIPYTPARFVRPWAEFERQWETTEPTHATPKLHVIGLNSVRPHRNQSGALGAARLDRAVERLRTAAAGAYRVVVLHHHLTGAPWRAAHKRPVARRNHVLDTLVEAGADLILSGHIHQAAISERREFAVTGGSAVLSIAPGFGQPRPNRLGEARGLHVYEIEDGALTASTYIWRDEWALTARRTFLR